jgi:RNA polymerase sigma factor (sigma-70 family)
MISEMVSVDNGNRLLEAIKACQNKVKAFIAKKVPISEVDDIFQEIVCNLIKADRINGPIDIAAAWLFKAAKNEIIDRYRKKRETLFWYAGEVEPTPEIMEISELMLKPPETSEDAYLRVLFWEELEKALAEMPPDQSYVFIQTELYGRSFKDLSAEIGLPVNTLLSRKHKAVLNLRDQLLELYQSIVYRY